MTDVHEPGTSEQGALQPIVVESAEAAIQSLMQSAADAGIQSVVETLVVDSRPHSIRTARYLVRKHARAIAMPANTAADVELAISELVTNAVEHGTGDEISVTIAGTDSELLMSVRSRWAEYPQTSVIKGVVNVAGRVKPLKLDDAEGVDSEAGVVAVPYVEPHSPAGRGLRIVATVADQVTVKADGPMLTVWCRFLVSH